jgi:hypothetical protein
MDCEVTLITAGPRAKGAFYEACNVGRKHGGNFRAPHHTVSQTGMAGELALAAGGVLVLDDANEFSHSAISVIKNLLPMMDEAVRPVVVLTLRWPLEGCHPEYVPAPVDFMSRQIERVGLMFEGWTVENHMGLDTRD